MKMDLKDLGFTTWHFKKLIQFQYPEHNLSRVIAVNKDNYIIRNREAELTAEITGKIMYGSESNLDFPTVGDWVYVHYFNENNFAIIHDILPRKSLIKRKVAGEKIEYQAIAANIDIAFIVQSLDINFNTRRLERYLIMANESNIEPVILLSKRDLISAEKLEQAISDIKHMQHKYDIFAFSNITGEGLDEIKEALKPSITYCLLGSSGVGKTTLLNRLIGENLYATSPVREKSGKGRHVTARRQLIILDQGGLIIDTPGMRELGNIEIHTGLDHTYAHIKKLSQGCRFRNCSHTTEPGCTVLSALNNGELSEEQYHNYLKIRKESEYYEMSYLEKRNKDKKFGKMYKNYKTMINKKK